MANLKELDLFSNQIGDAGMIAFADAIKPTPENPMGSLALLERLFLVGNQIGDEGMKAFSSAIYSGSLASLRTLFIDDGLWLGTPDLQQLKAACEARGIYLEAH
jgi:hypothetical protein